MRKLSTLAVAALASASLLAASQKELTNLQVSDRQIEKSDLAASPDKASSIIKSEPQGTKQFYFGNGMGYVNVNNSAYLVPIEYIMGKMVFDGNDVYIRNIVPTSNTTTWVKGSLSDDGREINIPVGQAVDVQKGIQLLVYPLVQAPTPSGGTTLVVDDTIDNITFTIDKDGVVSDWYDAEDVAIGVVWGYNVQWTGNACWGMTYEPTTIEGCKLPDDIFDITKDYSAAYKDIAGYTVGHILEVGFKDNDVYIHGLISGDANDWLHGTVSGDKIIVEKDQFLGFYNDLNFLFGVPCYIESFDFGEGEIYEYLVQTDEDLEFDYDAQSKTFSTDGHLAISPTRSDNFFQCETAFQLLKFAPWAGEVAAVPADPDFFEFYDYSEADGLGLINGNFPAKDVDGNFILPEKLYYRMYVDDDQLYTFTPDVYETLETEMTEIPVSYGDGVYIDAGGYFVFFIKDYERIGIQSVYKGGGETRCSNIVYSDGSVTPTGVTTIASDNKEVASVAYTDLMGRSISKPAGGLYIQTEVFTDGSRRSTLKK